MKNATKKDVEKAMEGRVIARAELVGTYEKTGGLHYRQESGRRS